MPTSINESLPSLSFADSESATLMVPVDEQKLAANIESEEAGTRLLGKDFTSRVVESDGPVC